MPSRARVEKGRLSREDAAATAARITYTTALEDLAAAGAVIEAVYEDRDVKRGLFALLDDALPGAAFLASNTSSIRIEELAQATARPERVVGLHFFSPVPVMRLVEIVAAPQTAPETLAAAEAARPRDRQGAGPRARSRRLRRQRAA